MCKYVLNYFCMILMNKLKVYSSLRDLYVFYFSFYSLDFIDNLWR